MRVFFSGSARHLAEDEQPAFAEAARHLGREAAGRGHVPLLHSEDKNTIDYHLVQGSRDAAEAAKTAVQIHIHRGIEDGKIFDDDDKLETTYIPYRWVNEAVGERLGSRVGAIAASDAVVLMGGGEGTRLVGRLAGDLRKPVVAIGSFGGAADEIFKARAEQYFDREDVAALAMALSGSWEEDNARDVLRICELLGGRHSYFLSYSHGELQAADHIEVLLRRSGARVYRDERELKPDDSIWETVTHRIGLSDTFVGLWSEAAASSEWCLNELGEALERKSKGPRPRRVTLVALDDTAIPEEMQDSLQLVGRERPDRVAAVQKLRDGESGEPAGAT